MHFSASRGENARRDEEGSKRESPSLFVYRFLTASLPNTAAGFQSQKYFLEGGGGGLFTGERHNVKTVLSD